MSKVGRNTIFTALILALTGLGLRWNTALLAKNQPLSIEQSVVASQTTGNFNVGVAFNKPTVTLGEDQDITITTKSNTDLKVVVEYASGLTKSAFAAKTSPTGSYTFGFKESNFRNVGVVIIKVLATSDGQTSQGEAEFNLSP